MITRLQPVSILLFGLIDRADILHNQPSRFIAWPALCLAGWPPNIAAHHSLKSPACSCVAITLPASS